MVDCMWSAEISLKPTMNHAAVSICWSVGGTFLCQFVFRMDHQNAKRVYIITLDSAPIKNTIRSDIVTCSQQGKLLSLPHGLRLHNLSTVFGNYWSTQHIYEDVFCHFLAKNNAIGWMNIPSGKKQLHRNNNTFGIWHSHKVKQTVLEMSYTIYKKRDFEKATLIIVNTECKSTDVQLYKILNLKKRNSYHLPINSEPNSKVHWSHEYEKGPILFGG